MLKYDVTFHGTVVAEVLSGRPLSEFWSAAGIVTASVPVASSVYVERELHDWIVHVTHDEKLTHRLSMFTLKDDDAFGEEVCVDLHMYCWKRGPGNGMVPRLDVDLLYITRSGISVATGDQTNRMPCPIAHFTAQCQRAEYRILDNPVADDAQLLKRMQRMSNAGWLPTNSDVHYAQSSDETCPICHESLSEGSHPIETTCGHQYHESCWVKHVNHSVARSTAELLPPPPPPPLSSVFQFSPIVARPHFHVTCPMCRHSIRSIFCSPG